MASCTHQYRQRAGSCPHPVVGDSTRCLWHQPHVRKTAPYVRELIECALATAPDALIEAHLSGARLARLQAPGCVLAGADLRDCDLRDSDLRDSDLSGCLLRRADLRGAQLAGARLRGADLSECRLIDADLAAADLSGAILVGTDLRAANLTGADLTGTQLSSFRWNRRSIFQRVRGVTADGEALPEPFTLLPIAVDDDGDPDHDATRDYPPVTRTPVIAGISTIAVPAVAAASTLPSAPHWRRRAAWSTGLMAAAAMVGVGGWWLGNWWDGRSGRTAGQGDAAATARQWESQHTATLAELTRTRSTLREALAAADGHRDRDRALDDRLRQLEAERSSAVTAARQAEAELLRLHAADDRAITTQLTICDLQQRLRELAGGSAKQETLARILADGVSRLEADNTRLGQMKDDQLALRQKLEVLGSERERLASELSAARSERDQAQTQLTRTRSDLDLAHVAIASYLNRLAESSLAETLIDSGERAPLLPVVAGQALALSGRYALTVRVDPVAAGPTPQTQIRVVLQRPSGEANPDITVMLFDAERQPLRRVSLGFAHVDGGPPLISGSAVVGLDRTAAFARVIVTPPTGPQQALR